MERRSPMSKAVRLSPRLAATTAALAALVACGEPVTEPTLHAKLVSAQSQVYQVFTSGDHVMTWDPITPAAAYVSWETTICTSTPLVGREANWQNPHNAYVLTGHPWAYSYFFAPWINAWSSNASVGPGGHNWTKYSTEVSGTGSFVIRLLADNCSWIYLDGTLVGVQGNDLSANSYGLTLNGAHTLEFIIFDGGGAAGGKFILETTTAPPPPLNNDLDNDTHLNADDAFPLDPSEWADGDGDGHGDNGDVFPGDPTEWADRDGDGVGDNGDAYPDDPSRSTKDGDSDGVNDDVDNCPALANSSQADFDGDGVGDACDADIDGDGVANGQDAYPTNSAEWADGDGDGHGDNGDVFPGDSTEWADRDGDGVGDNGDAYPDDPSRWKPDGDSDGVNDDVDNCPALANSSQADLDGDGVGDACDADVDGDGVANGQDAYPTNPAEWADSDGDGTGNNADAFDNSNTGATIVVGTCNTGVANKHMGGGTWSNDLVAAVRAAAVNHGAFVSAVSSLADGWKKAGLITGREQGAIVSCAARTK